MVQKKRAAVLPINIALLQNLINRDAEAYREEFKLQHQHYASLRDIFFANPHAAQGQDEFAELISFITHVTTHFPDETKDFPDELMTMLADNHEGLSAELSEKIVHSLTMLRNKDIVTSERYVQTLFPVLVRTESKLLRTQIYTSLIQMLKTVNQTAKNAKVNKMVQALLFNLLENAEANGIWAPRILRELWRRSIWDDSRSVEIMTQAAVHPDTKVAISAIRFFLGSDKERSDAQRAEDAEDDDALDMSAFKHKFKVNKKSHKKVKALESAVRAAAKKQNGPGKDATHLNFSAIHLLRDPQGFAERLFGAHLASQAGTGAGSVTRFNLEQKIECVNLVSRLIGTHKLTILGMYSFLLKYLTPKQRDVTQFLAAAAQASHDLVPPDALSPVVRKIADEFVSDGVSAEAAAAGLNAIREILARAPLAIDETLLHDLVAYRGSKSKPVTMAARGLIALFRDIMPSMLPAKERGKVATMALRASDAPDLKYGEVASSGIEGLELLQQWKKEHAAELAEAAAEGDDGWEVASMDDEDMSDEGWITMESDKEYAVSDSEDDEPAAKRKKAEEALEAAEGGEDAAADEPAAALSAEEQLAALQSLAATEILTPADFAKLDELKKEAGVRKALGQSHEEIVEAMSLVATSKHKQNKEERLAHVREGREGREFGSTKNKHQDKDRSTTNKEKARKKNFIMMIHKRDVQGKARKSLRDKQRVLRAHIKRQKMKKK